MPEKLLRHFHVVGVGLYLLSLIVVSLCFPDYALKPLWMAWGVGTTVLFFLSTYLFHNRWRHDPPKKFCHKVFWTAFGIRAVYVVAILYYYYFQTGIGMEYGAGDSLSYHLTASHLSDLAREGHFRAIFQTLNAHTMGFSDQGYVLYLTTLYSIFGKNILGPRLLKALMSAYMCVACYKLASRNIGEKAGRLTAVMTVFLPQFIHYNGTYLKETELIFLAILAMERFDDMLHNQHYKPGTILLVILLTSLTFGMRTIVGMILIGSYVIAVLSAKNQQISKKTKWIVLSTITILSILLVLTPIGKEVLVIFQVNFKESDYQIQKYQYLGLKYAQYASYKTMWPGAFTLPLTNLVEVANENQKMMNGTYFIKNYLAFFAMWCIVIAFRDKQWKKLSLIGSFTILYVVMIAFSFAFNSERYHLPAMPGIVMMTALAISRFRKKDFPYYWAYGLLLVGAIVTWNYIKLSGRGLIF